jgi:NADPH-dependent ferric siderophore reductase
MVIGGGELDGFEMELPAASVRLLLPPANEDDIVMPEWTGNQFELPGGRRAPIRTLTPRHFDDDRLELTVDIVLHDSGAASEWAAAATIGDETAVSGPGRGYEVDTAASSYLLVGDESAIPAMSQLLEHIPSGIPVQVHVEIAHPSARHDLPPRPAVDVTWHELPEGAEPGDELVAAVERLEEVPPAVWVAGEAAAVQRIRKHLFDGRGMSRSDVTARGYWKKGRSAT